MLDETKKYVRPKTMQHADAILLAQRLHVRFDQAPFPLILVGIVFGPLAKITSRIRIMLAFLGSHVLVH